MRLPSRQRGLGLWGWIFVLGIIGFFAIVGAKTLPIYLNQMKITKAVNNAAHDEVNAAADVNTIRKSLQRYWDVEDIRFLEPKEVKIVRTPDGGRAMIYKYEAKERLFYNISIAVDFEEQIPMRRAAS